MIPEVYGWIDPESCPLHANAANPPPRHIKNAPIELWVITTDDPAIQLDRLCAWWKSLKGVGALRIWIACDTGGLASADACGRFREMTLRVTLRAHEQVGPEGLIASLAGGRKTMSADLHGAISFFGAAMLLHVVETRALPDVIRNPADTFGLEPLPSHEADAIQVVELGSMSPSELVYPRLGPHTLDSLTFPVGWPECGKPLHWKDDGASIRAEIDQRQRDSAALIGNFLSSVTAGARTDTWPSLLRLPPRQLAQLRATPISNRQLAWLDELPKADLHSHLGGQLSLDAQRRVARQILADSPASQREQSRQLAAPLLARPLEPWCWDWPRTSKHLTPETRALCGAHVLCQWPEDALMALLYGATEPRVGLKTRHPEGFAAYERPGELTGSAQLGHPAAIPIYAAEVVARARREGLWYLELRGSPQKYRPADPLGFLRELRDALRAAGASTTDQSAFQPGQPVIGFIWILDRRQRGLIQTSITDAVRARMQLGDFLVGLDLAGDEGTSRPEELAPLFLPAFEACLPITIHAGEGEPAHNIWQAAYHLHADRIGHGLTLAEHPTLARRFADRGIALELCPSSNREVVGFHDPGVAESRDFPAYPLRELLQLGIPLSLCTDNPGISRTTLSLEYIAASRMTGDEGLTQFEGLTLIRNAFMQSFAPVPLRTGLLAAADQVIYRLLGKPGPANSDDRDG